MLDGSASKRRCNAKGRRACAPDAYMIRASDLPVPLWAVPPASSRTGSPARHLRCQAASLFLLCHDEFISTGKNSFLLDACTLPDDRAPPDERRERKSRLDKATTLDTSMRRRWRLVWVPIDFRDNWSESA